MTCMARIPSNGGSLIDMFIKTFIAWLWTILASLVNCQLIITIPHHVTYFPPDSHTNCCQICILTGSLTFVIHSQLPKCLIYLYSSLSWFLGLPQPHFFWGCACSCERRLQGETGRCWYGCGGCWVNNLWPSSISNVNNPLQVLTKYTAGFLSHHGYYGVVCTWTHHRYGAEFHDLQYTCAKP